MNYFEQNKRILIGIIFIILTVLVIIFYGRESSYIGSEEEITATVYPLEVSLGDTVWFKDSTENVRRIEWDFGNTKKTSKTAYNAIPISVNSYSINSYCAALRSVSTTGRASTSRKPHQPASSASTAPATLPARGTRGEAVQVKPKKLISHTAAEKTQGPYTLTVCLYEK